MSSELWLQDTVLVNLKLLFWETKNFIFQQKSSFLSKGSSSYTSIIHSTLVMLDGSSKLWKQYKVFNLWIYVCENLFFCFFLQFFFLSYESALRIEGRKMLMIVWNEKNFLPPIFFYSSLFNSNIRNLCTKE